MHRKFHVIYPAVDFSAPARYNGENTEGAKAMEEIQVRQYREGDAPPLAALIRQNLLEVNIRDYPREEMEVLAEQYCAERLRQLAASARFYVACTREHLVVGCGAVSPGKRAGSCWVQTVFVHPEWHGAGVGKRIMQALEQDPLAAKTGRIELGASKSAHGFYLALGYTDIFPEPDEHGLYQMTKQLD